MDNKDELVQVNISLPKSYLSILPELMRVVTTACCSSYSWDSMKLSVNSDVSSDKGSRIILNLGKSVSLDSEVIQGKLHTCREAICKHQRSWDDLVGDVRMTTFARRSLKEYFKEQEKSDEEIERSGWLEKELSDEMFFPSWYDHLRLKSVSQLGDGFFQTEMLQDQAHLPAPVFEVKHVQPEPFYESESEEYFPLKKNVKPYTKTVEISDETFRLQKVCDRAKNYTQAQDLKRGNDDIAPSTNTTFTIRELKERLDPPVPSQPEIYQENYVFLKSTPQEVNDKDYTYRQYLCYDEDLPSYPLCETDESMNQRKDTTIKNNELQQNFRRQMPTDDFKNATETMESVLDYDRDDEMIVVMPPSIKKTMFHRSYSANVISRQYNDEDSTKRECSPSKKKKREEKRRPKSGPEKKVDFTRPSEKDELSQGDSLLISEGRQDSIRNLILNTALETMTTGPNDVFKEKKKKRKTYENPDKRNDGIKIESQKDPFKDHDKRIKEKKHKVEEKDKEAGPTLVISYKPYEDDTKSDLIKSKPKSSHREDKGNKQEVNHKKSERKKVCDEVYEAKLTFHTPEKHSDKREGRSRGKGDEKKLNKRPRSEKDDKARTLETKPPSKKASKAATQHELAQDKVIVDTLKSKRRGFLGKRGSPGLTVKEETHPSTDDKISTDLEEKSHNKRAMSFLELISVMTEEVKQFGKKKDHKRLRDKIS